MKKDTGSFRSFGDVDPAVNEILQESQQRAANRARTPAQRRKAARDAARNKITIDLAPSTTAQLRALAEELSVPISGLAGYLLARALGEIPTEEIERARVPSRSMRYEYVLPTEEK